MQIRGVFLLDYIKLVNHTRDKDWEQFLTPEDWELCKEMIVPTAWYPVETMGRIARGIHELICNRDYNFIRLYGRTRAPELFQDARPFLVKNDIAAALPSFRHIVDRYVDEVNVTVEHVADDHCLVSWYPVDGAPSFDCYREVMAGNLEWLIEENGGEDAIAEFIEERRDGRLACIIRVNWSSPD